MPAISFNGRKYDHHLLKAYAPKFEESLYDYIYDLMGMESYSEFNWDAIVSSYKLQDEVANRCLHNYIDRDYCIQLENVQKGKCLY